MYETLPIYHAPLVQEARHATYLDREIRHALNQLSLFEKDVFETKIIGRKSVKETANQLLTDEKRIYNALDRIKKKIKIHLIQ